MPVSSAGHLPQITSTSYPALVSYLSSNYNAQRVSNWTVSIRILRSSFESSKDSPSRPKMMYLVNLSEFPTETFVLVEDAEKDTRASIKARHAAQKQQGMLVDSTESQQQMDTLSQLKASLQTTSTRYTLFTSSSHFPLLLSRLNLPPPLGAPSMGDGVTNAQAAAGPGAWLPRGAPILIEGATYELPSATRYGVEETVEGGNCEWKVRLGMIQSGGTRSSGAVVENEFLPLNRLANPMLLLSHLQNLFPPYLTTPSQNAGTQAVRGTVISHPTAEQWEEVIPASNEVWCADLDKLQGRDGVGWKGKERGRRLAYLYVMLLRSQGVV